MMKAIIAALCLSVSMAQAAVIAEARDGPVRVELHDQAGHCQDGAMLSIWIQGDSKTTGCWRLVGQQVVQIAWSDAEITRVPVTMFKPVAKS